MAGNEPVSGKIDGEDLPTILVIAPHVTLLKLLEMTLKLEFACEVLAYVGGRSALETAKYVTPDLVIIHAHLLDLDALELADRLHNMNGFASVPMLLTHTPVDAWHKSQSSHNAISVGRFLCSSAQIPGPHLTRIWNLFLSQPPGIASQIAYGCRLPALESYQANERNVKGRR